MRKTYRDEWRVMVTIKPRRPADLGLTGLGELAEFVAPTGPITVAVLPRRLGSLGFGTLSMGDRLVSRDIEGDYRRRCEEIAAELRQRPQVAEVTVTCTETHTCSHCGLRWEVLSEAEANDGCVQDEHSIAGEPVCCDKAIAEFRTERGITVHAEGVVAYRHCLPGHPDTLLCREHGYPWFAQPLTSDDLPDGGICTYGRGGLGECGRDVLAVGSGESA